jgi:hypothetical protein
VNWWRRYWFDDGGRIAIAIVRIAIAIAVLMVLANLREVDLGVAPDHYRPLGLWQVLGQTQPPEGLVDLLRAIAWLATFAMLVGIGSRAATAVSLAASLALVWLYFSGLYTVGRWSHGYNIVFLAHIAMLGARCGDALSLDALIRRRRGLPPLDVVRGYQWSLRLVQLAVALVFVGACLYKLASGHFTLAWATSDNLRNQLLVRYDLAGLPRSPIADWLIDDVWRYRTGALLNMITQLAPLVAIALPRRPRVRAVIAAMFVGEVLGIEAIMSLPNRHWLPLVAVFIDWDRLLRVKAPAAPAEWTAPRRPQIFIAAFVAIDLVLTLVPRLSERLGTYPFSSFPLYASIRATQPWSEHLPYVLAGDHFVTDKHDAVLERDLEFANRRMFNVVDPAALRGRLELIREQIGARLVRHHLALYVAPAYPAEARLDKQPIAITGELDGDRFRTVLGTWTRTTITLRPQQVDTRGARLVYYTEDTTPVPLAAQRDGDVFTLDQPLPDDALHVVAIIDGTAWLVASTTTRR